MLERMRQSVVFSNPWLPTILCVVLVVLWFTRWELQASKTYDEGWVKWYTDRWTGGAWVFVGTKNVSGRLPIPPLPLGEEDTREYHVLEARRATNLTKLWGCAGVLSLAWLGFALSTARKSQVR